MAPPDVIWKADEDDWRDLTDELSSTAFTAVSRSGATRIIDAPSGPRRLRRHLRLPLEGGHHMLGDGQRALGSKLSGWALLHEVHITPCGVTLTEPGSWINEDGSVTGFGYWAKGTRLRLVLAGIVPNWHITEPGRSVLESIVRHATEPVSAGHPPWPCGALRCIRTD